MEEAEEVRQLCEKICRILNETSSSNAAHVRKLRELSELSSSSCSKKFFTAFTRSITPLLAFHRRTAAAERVMRFISVFACSRYSSHSNSDGDNFLENVLQFLLVAAASANKTARFRACQIISEIVMRLPDDAEVSSEIWNEVIESMKGRVGDKIPSIRAFSVRALSRFANDSDNCDVLEIFLEALSLEQNMEVRKTTILSLPPSTMTLNAIVESTLDVSESIRRASYCVLARKFPLQSLSIKFRTVILKRGLADRSDVVTKECLKLLKEEWLLKCCNGDAIELLKYLDVETYESVGEMAMKALLNDGLVKLHDQQSLRKLIEYSSVETKGEEGDMIDIQLLEPEVALYWRMVCVYLEKEARAKGSDAAKTTGMEAAVYAAEASDSNDLLEKVLPDTVADYVKFVKAHLEAGPNYRFSSRQLLLLGELLDFSDATNRKVGSNFLQELLHRQLEYEVDDEGNQVLIGDGINLGGDRDWANAVSSLAKKIHASAGEFEETLVRVVEGLGQPCRERTADFLQWMHCLSVVCLLLENAKSSHLMQGMSLESSELLKSLLLPGTRHSHFDVQRVAIRCVGLFGLLEKKPSEELMKQLKLSFIEGPPSVSILACKALVDLGMWHGFQELDRLVGCEAPSMLGNSSSHVSFDDVDQAMDIPLLDLLFVGFDANNCPRSEEMDENESTLCVLAEGFAKILLLSENYPTLPAAFHHILLSKLIKLYFYDENEDSQRLKQCLSVFFENYSSISRNHKRCISLAFIPAMRLMWPGIDGNPGGGSVIISKLRKKAVQGSRFVLQMMQSPLYSREDSSPDPSLETGEEGLALRIAADVIGLKGKRTSAEKSYVLALCRTLPLIHFRVQEQGPIKLMRELLGLMLQYVTDDKEVTKEMKGMMEKLRALDTSPDDDKLPREEARLILERLDISIDLDQESSMVVPCTPAPPRSTRANRVRKQARKEETSDEESPGSMAPPTVQETRTRSQRASKTAALSKLTSKEVPEVDDDDEIFGDHSDGGSEEDSDLSDQSET